MASIIVLNHLKLKVQIILEIPKYSHLFDEAECRMTVDSHNTAFTIDSKIGDVNPDAATTGRPHN